MKCSVAHQHLEVFEAPDPELCNFLLVHPQNQPFRVILMHSGLAHPASKIKVGMMMQPCANSASEETLAFPISEAIGLGCVMAVQYFCSNNLFPGECSYHTMKAIATSSISQRVTCLGLGKHLSLFHQSRRLQSSRLEAKVIREV